MALDYSIILLSSALSILDNKSHSWWDWVRSGSASTTLNNFKGVIIYKVNV